VVPFSGLAYGVGTFFEESRALAPRPWAQTRQAALYHSQRRQAVHRRIDPAVHGDIRRRFAFPIVILAGRITMKGAIVSTAQLGIVVRGVNLPADQPAHGAPYDHI